MKRCLFVLLALSGCAGAQPPEPVVRTVTVEKAIPVACLQSDQRPKLPDPIKPIPVVDKAYTAWLEQWITRWLAYGDRAEKVFNSCEGKYQ